MYLLHRYSVQDRKAEGRADREDSHISEEKEKEKKTCCAQIQKKGGAVRRVSVLVYSSFRSASNKTNMRALHLVLVL